MADILRAAASAAPARARGSRWGGFATALLRDVPSLLAAGFIALLVVVAVFAPLLAPYGPSLVSASASFRPPSWQHPFGTDLFGRDILSRVIYGTRLSLLVGVLAVAVGAVGGTFLGIAAGISARHAEQAIMRCIDVALAFPFILLAILILAFFGPGIQNVMLAVGIAYVPRFTRITHASTLSLREMEFVSAARACGAGPGRVMLRHILPNLFQVLAVYGSFSIPIAILIEAGLDYLGLGVVPPTPTWGAIINEGRQSLMIAPWESVLPGLVIMLAVLAFNLFGEAVANYLDPRANIGLPR